MAVPNTNKFKLSDVIAEINPSVNSLSGCFADAIAGNFNPLYEGSKDRLLNFRGYLSAIADQILYDFTSSAGVCATINLQGVYYDQDKDFFTTTSLWSTPARDTISPTGYYKISQYRYWNGTPGELGILTNC